MAWHAKPSGAYAYNSTEGTDNIWEIDTYFENLGYTTEAVAGMCGNIVGESGLNPWRWQNDTVNLTRGYGLYQWTPATRYTVDASSIPGHSPNMSTTQVDGGALSDAEAQLICFSSNFLNKWISEAWSSSWSTTQYAYLYAMRNEMIRLYGSNDRLTLAQFTQIDNVAYATLAILICFEQPGVPNYDDRLPFANAIYEILTGHPPTPPAPIRRRKMPLWMYLRYW
jgi:hypothetical protein